MSNRVAILKVHTGDELIIRGDPTEGSIKDFIREHNRRYFAGEPGGPDGLPAYLVVAAYYAEDESEDAALEEIDLSDL